MITKEFKEQLLKEIILCKELNELTLEIKDMFFEIINQEIEKRYSIMIEINKILCETNAYDACCKHVLNFNPDRSDNVYAYIVTIIRSSFANTIMPILRKRGKTKIISI
jgi:hypothetical protein